MPGGKFGTVDEFLTRGSDAFATGIERKRRKINTSRAKVKRSRRYALRIEISKHEYMSANVLLKVTTKINANATPTMFTRKVYFKYDYRAQDQPGLALSWEP